MFPVHGLEELILLKCPYDSKQSQLHGNLYQNSNDIFHRNRNNNFGRKHLQITYPIRGYYPKYKLN